MPVECVPFVKVFTLLPLATIFGPEQRIGTRVGPCTGKTPCRSQTRTVGQGAHGIH